MPEPAARLRKPDPRVRTGCNARLGTAYDDNKEERSIGKTFSYSAKSRRALKLSMDAVKADIPSPEGQAAAGDLANFADGGAELYFFDTKEV